MKSTSCLGFSVAYNLVNHGDEYNKFQDFVAGLLSEGALFFGLEGEKNYPISNTSEIKRYLSNQSFRVWSGRVVISYKIFLQLMEKFVLDFEKNESDFKAKCQNWLETLKRYPHLWITIEIPAQNQFAPVLINYWNYTPNFIETAFFEIEKQEPDYYSIENVAVYLVEEIYDHIDNLFSAFVFQNGRFVYPNQELRKLSFTYFLQDKFENEGEFEKFEHFLPLYQKALLATSPDSITTMRLQEYFSLVYSKGFIGMTGQPQTGKTPKLQILIDEGEKQRDDKRTLNILKELSIYEKLGAYLNTLSEFVFPSVEQSIEKIVNGLTEVSGMSNQLKIDKDLSFTTSDLLTLIKRCEIIDENLYKNVAGLFEIRNFLSSIYSNAVSVRHEVMEMNRRLRFEQISDPLSYVKERVGQCDRIVDLSHQAEKSLIEYYQELSPVQNSVAQTRLSIYGKYDAKKETEEYQIKDICFVIMPFREEFDQIYDECIQPVFTENDLGLDCQRGDSIFGTTAIMNQVWKAICRSRVVIAELSSRSPNVLYELGIAHVLRKPAIMITQSMDDVPFDIKHLRCIVYDNSERGKQILKFTLAKTISEVLESDLREVVLFED